MSPHERLALRARQVGSAPAHEVPSPCLSVCRMSAGTQLCIGCFRTLDEIAAWGRMEDGAKRDVWRLIEQRISQQEVREENP